LARHEDAVRLFSAAERIRAATGAAPEGDDPVLARDIAASRAALGAKGLRALEDAVRDAPVEAVVAEAREIADQVVAGAASVAAPEPDTPERRLVQAFGLTPREIEILGYLVDHRSDREIGDTLFISPRTVGTHVNAIRGKMGVTSRREAARLAAEAGLGERPGT
jgi:DNA-binding CsgD family transcriptional regulator